MPCDRTLPRPFVKEGHTMHVRSIGTIAAASAIAVMSVVGVLRGAADAPPATSAAALAVDHATLERPPPPAALFPSHPVAPGQAAGSAQAGTTAAPTAMLAEQAFKNVTALK